MKPRSKIHEIFALFFVLRLDEFIIFQEIFPGSRQVLTLS